MRQRRDISDEARGWPRPVQVAGLVLLAIIVLLHTVGDTADEVGVVNLGSLAPYRSAEGLADEAGARASREDLPGAERLATRAVKRLPVSQPVVRALGEIRLLREDTGAWSNETILVAGKLGWRDRQTQARLLMAAAQNGDLSGAVDRIDATMRRSEISEEVYVAVAAALEEPNLRRAMARRIAENPPWRADLFAAAGEFGDARATLAMVELLSEVEAIERGPLPASQIDPVLSRMARLRMDEELATSARRFAGYLERSDLLRDPEFEILSDRSSGAETAEGPFDWKKGGAQATVVSASSSDDADAVLRVQSRSRVPAVALFQNLHLAPGRYRFEFLQKDGENLSWRVRCGRQTIAETNDRGMGDIEERSSLAFDVSGTCPIQRLELTTSRNLRGEVARGSWSNLAIQRIS